MAKPWSSTVLTLELEDLKKHMLSVQAEVGRCLARLECVTAVVRAEQEVDRNKKVEDEIRFPGPVLERFVDAHHRACLAAESEKSLAAFRDISGNQHIQSEMTYRHEECISTIDRSYGSIILKNKVKELSSGFKEAGEIVTVAVDETTREENDEISDAASFDGIPLSTRPSLSRKCRKNVVDLKDLEHCIDEATTVIAASSNAALVSNSVSFQDSMVISSSQSIKDHVSFDSLKEAQNLTERIKKNISVSRSDVRLIIGSKGTNINRITKETGVSIVVGNKVAGRHDRLVELCGEKVSVDKALEMINKSLLKENLTKLTLSDYDVGLLLWNQGASMNRITDATAVSIAVRDRVKGRQGRLLELSGKKASVDKALEMLKENAALDMPKENLMTMTVSNDEAGTIIGTSGSNIKKIIKETGVALTVDNWVKGKQDRLVELWGEEASVEQALMMIKKMNCWIG